MRQASVDPCCSHLASRQCFFVCMLKILGRIIGILTGSGQLFSLSSVLLAGSRRIERGWLLAYWLLDLLT